MCVWVTEMTMGNITWGAHSNNHFTFLMLPFNPVLYNQRHISHDETETTQYYKIFSHYKGAVSNCKPNLIHVLVSTLSRCRFPSRTSSCDGHGYSRRG